MKLKHILVCIFSLIAVMVAAQANNPVRIGIDGLSHDHIHGILNGHKDRTDIVIVGIAESNHALVEKYARRYGFDPAIAYDDLATMVDRVKPEGVVAFNSIRDHLSTVEVCAPRGIHVMVEKPLAVDGAAAERMARLAQQHHIHLLTNYETTWYPSNHKLFGMAVNEQLIGPLNKILINDGHRGPREIGCSEEFLTWLTDPAMNGGGAVVDFGCYGANLATWLMGGEEPVAVTALLQQVKPEVYPKVDDQATIIVQYPKTQAVIQASWNWPYDRKDMEVYGSSGFIKALNATHLEYNLDRRKPVEHLKVEEFPIAAREPFTYFARVICGTISVAPTDLSSLENNLSVVRILDAARQSASEGRTVYLTSPVRR